MRLSPVTHYVPDSYRECVTQVIYLTLLIAILSVRPAQGSVQGKMTDTVRCKNHPEQSYALYLPESYTDTVKWPVIFIIDPGGRGSLAVDSFKMGAGKYGYILAASNNSSSGSLERTFEIADILFEDVRDRFSVDSARIYTAGFISAGNFC